MSRYLINKSTLDDIARAICEKNGTDSNIYAKDFADKIRDISTGIPKETVIGLIDRKITEIHIPEGTTGIGDGAFYCCTVLESVKIPNTVTFLGSRSFRECNKLTSVEIPDSVTVIETEAFQLCRTLKTVTFGSGLERIQNSAFKGNSECLIYDFSKLTSITKPPALDAEAFFGISENAKIIVPSGLYNDWVTATNWANYEHLFVMAEDFTVCGNTSKTYFGQTWQDWIDSSWNTVGACVQDGVVYVNEKPLYKQGGGYSEYYADDVLTLATHEISGGAAYSNYSGYVAFKLCGAWTYGLTGTRLGEWINSVFNNLGAVIQTDGEDYWVQLPDGTTGELYNTEEEITDIEMYDGATYW